MELDTAYKRRLAGTTTGHLLIHHLSSGRDSDSEDRTNSERRRTRYAMRRLELEEECIFFAAVLALLAGVCGARWADDSRQKER